MESAQRFGTAVAGGAREADLLPALGFLPHTRDLLRELARTLRELQAEPTWMTAAAAGDIDYLAALEQDLPRR